MSPLRRIFWILSLCVLVAGCASASFRPALLPGAGLAPGDCEAPPEIAVGATVRVTTRGGEVLTGVVSRLTPELLVISRGDEPGAEPLRIAVADVATVEMQSAETGERVGVIVALGVGALLVISTVQGLSSFR